MNKMQYAINKVLSFATKQQRLNYQSFIQDESIKQINICFQPIDINVIDYRIIDKICAEIWHFLSKKLN